ncbi:MAG TPA: metallophosphoesterase [Bryobacteraceae bacterium]|jgi:3',5'-cyclic AMP phosphodiesterase CpdA|nr:metallophosphoesterase [Bryobacteraceae bacterium]
MFFSAHRAIALLLAAMPAFAAEPFFFIQATDPQFGMFAEDKNFVHETANWEFVVANANRLHPAFVVVCGDLTNKAADADQIAEYKRINRKLDKNIHLYNVAGNHDVTNEPTPATLAAYRRNFGKDYYSFREGPVYGIVLDSNLLKAPAHAAGEAARQEKWLEGELAQARASDVMPVIFQHIPLFLEKADEPEQYFNLPLETRARILALLHKYGVHYVFAGHYHRNSYGKDGDLEMITSGPAGMPIGPDPSGFRIAEVKDGRIEQKYYSLGTIPHVFPVPPPKP